MGTWRVFTKSVRFTFRTKARFFIFVLIFAVLAGWVAFFVDTFDDYNTTKLIQQRGMGIKADFDGAVTGIQADSLIDDIMDIDGVETTYSLRSISIGEGARIFGFDVSNPWGLKSVNPNNVETGHFPTTDEEILIPAVDKLNASRVLHVSLPVGSIINIHEADGPRVEVSGLLAKPGLRPYEGSIRMFMSNTMFDTVVEELGLDADNAIYEEMTIIVEGSPFADETYETAEDIHDSVLELLSDTDTYGDWQDSIDFASIQERIRDRNRGVTSFIGGAGFGLLVSMLYSFLLVRMRHQEIAILRALGYTKREVNVSLFAEIMTITTVAYMIGMGAMQGAFLYMSGGKLFGLMRPLAMGVSFATVVLMNIPGVLLASLRSLRVSPIEVFRNK